MKNFFPEFLNALKGSGTQADLARILEISQPSVSDLLSGKTEPSYEVLKRLVAKGYNPSAMLAGRGTLRMDEQQLELPHSVHLVAQKLVQYPGLVEPLSKMIEAREELEKASQELKVKFKYPKSKREK